MTSINKWKYILLPKEDLKGYSSFFRLFFGSNMEREFFAKKYSLLAKSEL